MCDYDECDPFGIPSTEIWRWRDDTGWSETPYTVPPRATYGAPKDPLYIEVEGSWAWCKLPSGWGLGKGMMNYEEALSIAREWAAVGPEAIKAEWDTKCAANSASGEPYPDEVADDPERHLYDPELWAGMEEELAQ